MQVLHIANEHLGNTEESDDAEEFEHFCWIISSSVYSLPLRFKVLGFG